MTSPFPGMDPYLEQHWRDVHHSLCTYTRDELSSQILPSLIARLDERVVLQSREDIEMGRSRARLPDVRMDERDPQRSFAPSTGDTQETDGGVAVAEPVVIEMDEVHEAFVQIIEPGSGKLVTVIEFLSPSNKRGQGLADYRDKRRELRGLGVSLVGVDLVREGDPAWHGIPSVYMGEKLHTPYRVVVTRGWLQRRFELYPINLWQRLPKVRIPLREGEKDATLDLQGLLRKAYENGSYWATADYAKEPLPPLSEDEAAWADRTLRAAGRRK